MVKTTFIKAFRLKLTLMGSAVSLQLIGVGKRHCRVLYIIPAQPELISSNVRLIPHNKTHL